MPNKLRSLSGNDLVRIFSTFGFVKSAQRGSHVKLKRNAQGRGQILTIPLHKEIDKGTHRAIFKQAFRYGTRSSLLRRVKQEHLNFPN